jgi:hypothetical protein
MNFTMTKIAAALALTVASSAAQSGDFKGYQEYAWAVRDGDVAAVPEPETYALMLAGLGLVGFMARRKKPKPSAIL